MRLDQNAVLATSEGKGPEAKRAEKIVYPENPRYRKVRFLSNLMDQSIILPSGYRIGLDPLLGLVPGIGDGLGAAISCYMVYQAARLGVAKRVLLRMLGNIGLEALVGLIPVLGDIFDATYKANMRNLRLLDQHYNPAMPERSARWITGWIASFLGLLLLGLFTSFFFVMRFLAAVASLLVPGAKL